MNLLKVENPKNSINNERNPEPEKNDRNAMKRDILKDLLVSFMKEVEFIHTLNVWLLIPKNANHVYGPQNFSFHLPKNNFVDKRLNWVTFGARKKGIFRKEGITLNFELNPNLFKNEMGPRALVDYSDEKIKEYADKHIFTSEKELADFLVKYFYDEKFVTASDFFKTFENQVYKYYQELRNCHAII